MDLVTYDPALPELPLLRGLRLPSSDGAVPPARFDWAGYVIRLAQVVAERRASPDAA
ncbi:hypothetical protein [Rubellimicrobium roseum]|uniref:hypothetical protein n=1 Tax=Rubellimicrobium roseum TaxID=687525 RepID=UPI00159BD0CE|nr:hypothetical protein [Rubellimicrobium roseum]